MTGHVTDPRLVMLRVQLYTAMQTLRGEDDLGEFWALIRELASMMPDAAAVPHLTPPPPEAAVADAVLALHKVAGGGEYCQEDGFYWPCRTARAVLGEDRALEDRGE